MMHTNYSINAPYGLGTDGAISDIISVGESWAEHVAQVFSDIQYTGFPTTKFKQGITYLNGLPTGFTSHLNAIEEFDPNNNADHIDGYPREFIMICLMQEMSLTLLPMELLATQMNNFLMLLILI